MVRNFVRYILRSEGGKNRVLNALTGFCYSSHDSKLESCHLAFDSNSYVLAPFPSRGRIDTGKEVDTGWGLKYFP